MPAKPAKPKKKPAKPAPALAPSPDQRAAASPTPATLDATDKQPQTTPKKKTKPGPESKFTQALADYICLEIASGRSLRSITQDPGMPTLTTVMRWLAMDEHASFREQYARAREQQMDAMAEELLEIADDGTNDFRPDDDGNPVLDSEHIQRSRLRVDTRKWLMAKLQPKKYGDKQQVDMNLSLAKALDSV